MEGLDENWHTMHTIQTTVLDSKWDRWISKINPQLPLPSPTISYPYPIVSYKPYICSHRKTRLISPHHPPHYHLHHHPTSNNQQCCFIWISNSYSHAFTITTVAYSAKLLQYQSQSQSQPHPIPISSSFITISSFVHHRPAALPISSWILNNTNTNTTMKTKLHCIAFIIIINNINSNFLSFTSLNSYSKVNIWLV